MTINSVGNTSPTGTDETSHNSAGNGRDFNQTLEVTRQAQNLPETHANQATLFHYNKTKAPPKKETPKAPAAKKPPPKKTDVKSTEIALKKYPSSTKLKDLCDNWLDQDTQDYIGGHIKGKDVRYGTFKDHPGKLHIYFILSAFCPRSMRDPCAALACRVRRRALGTLPDLRESHLIPRNTSARPQISCTEPVIGRVAHIGWICSISEENRELIRPVEPDRVSSA